MGIKLKLSCFLIVVLLTTIYATCSKKGNCFRPIYSFAVSLKAYPDFDSITRFDTLWFDLDIPVQLTDLNSNQIIDFSNAGNLGIDITFYELLGNHNIKP